MTIPLNWPIHLSFLFLYNDEKGAVIIWFPNDTLLNRLRNKFGYGIDNSEASEMRETLKKYTPEETKEFEREIEIKTTTERIKLMHANIKKMMNGLEKMMSEGNGR